MNFDIDVSGEDLLNKNYVVCVANQDSLIRGFKINEELVSIISSRYGQGFYKRYKKSKKGKADLKVRIYCIIVYYLFRSLKLKHGQNISLNICRDFEGRSEDIKVNFNYFLEIILGLKIENMHFRTLDKDSNADKYSYLMRKDTKDTMNTYVPITLEEIEYWLKK